MPPGPMVDMRPLRLGEFVAQLPNVGQTSRAQFRGIVKEKTASDEHIEKLEKALVACGKKIKELEATEVDWEKEDDETYILEAKYVYVYSIPFK
jgi:hypothetical protein